jgi:ABC-2 type transport system permease protein
MPEWVQAISNWLPFKWTFQFPIEVVIGRLTTEEIWRGIGAQLIWIAITGVGYSVVWRRAIKQFTAVGT